MPSASPPARAAKAAQQSPAPPSPQPSRQPSTQSPSQQPSESSAAQAQVSEEEADLAIIANVTASSLRFDAVPNVTVEFPGRPRRDTIWEAERTNLPRPVRPGVTYRDIGVRLKIVSVFADIDRIVAEALGEVPPPDDQTRPDAPPLGASGAAEPSAAGDVTAREGVTPQQSESVAASPLKDSNGAVVVGRAPSTAARRTRASSARRQR